MYDRAKELIERLGLEPHVEGGWYRQTFSGETKPAFLPEYPDSERPQYTSIYFLITEDDFSAFHRIRSDELWYFHAGDPLEIEIIEDQDRCETLVLGPSIDGFDAQHRVPGGSWFASHLQEGGQWALVGCMVSPGFDFRDFELGRRRELVAEFPNCEALIRRYTRN